MLNDGYSYQQTAEILLLDDATIRRWQAIFESKGINSLLSDNYTGGTSKLTDGETATETVSHLENNVYLTAKEICAYVRNKYGVEYAVKGMAILLHNLGFRYGKPRHIPGKAKMEAQLGFINLY